MFTPPPPPPPPPPPGTDVDPTRAALDTLRDILATLDVSEVPVPITFFDELDALCAPPPCPAPLNAGIRG